MNQFSQNQGRLEIKEQDFEEIFWSQYEEQKLSEADKEFMDSPKLTSRCKLHTGFDNKTVPCTYDVSDGLNLS